MNAIESPAGRVSGPIAAIAAIDLDLCSRCRKKYLPKQPSDPLGRDVLRKAADGMTSDPDPRAERIRRRHERKAQARLQRSLRSLTREVGLVGAITLHLSGAQLPAEVPESEECEACQRRAARTARRRAAFAGLPAAAAV